jgi:CubicO group peptidase (beta-lactamase class C family)
MNAYVERGDMPGLVMLLGHQGETWIESLGVRDLESGAPMTADTIFRIASMTKPVTAVASLMLVEDGTLGLDDPVDEWLPELANRKVVCSTTGPLDDTVPATRPITLRHLLAFSFGLGALMLDEGQSPLQDAMYERNVGPGPFPSPNDPDTFMRLLGELPLAHQPGDGWLYHTGADVAGVLVARASGMSLERFFQERIFGPLGMVDTAYHVPEDKLSRLATAYNEGDNALKVMDPARGGIWSRPPAFLSGGGGLVSTASDYNTFARMLLDMGRGPEGPLLRPESVAEMTRDQITPRIKDDYPFIPNFWDRTGWGLGVQVLTARDQFGRSPGSYLWSGGYNTHWCNDPAQGVTGMLLCQVLMGGPAASGMVDEFWTQAYRALDH